MVTYSKDQAFLDAYSMENCSYLAKIEKKKIYQFLKRFCTIPEEQTLRLYFRRGNRFEENQITSVY